uniref:Hydrophobic seed protein domain-containing protein n=1 Tax=Aegilops tauschii subsp. strangulata TaxID=200361 RepID=A0A452ZNY2_AEGTS
RLIHSSSISDNSHHQPGNHGVLPHPSPRHHPPGRGFCPSKWPGPAASTGNGTSTIRLWRRPLLVGRRSQARRVRRDLQLGRMGLANKDRCCRQIRGMPNAADCLSVAFSRADLRIRFNIGNHVNAVLTACGVAHVLDHVCVAIH